MFWGGKPLSISCLPTACQTQVCPLSTEQPQPLAETWIVFAFPCWGFASCPGNITIPEKAHLSVLSCSFVLAQGPKSTLSGTCTFRGVLTNPLARKLKCGEPPRKAQLVSCQEQGRRGQSPPAIFTCKGESTSSQT